MTILRDRVTEVGTSNNLPGGEGGGGGGGGITQKIIRLRRVGYTLTKGKGLMLETSTQ